jgi:hypothetical protein
LACTKPGFLFPVVVDVTEFMFNEYHVENISDSVS